MYTLKHRVPSIGRRSVWFSEEDIVLLQLIWDFKYLSLYQLKYYNERRFHISSGTTEKKLRKWRDAGIVISDTYTKRPLTNVYYRIGEEGLAVLEKISNIKKNERVLVEELSGKRNFDHFFGLRDAALLTLIKLHREGKEVKSIPPSVIPYFEKGLEGTTPIVVPDWVLKSQYGYLDIELDTGTETLTRITEKINKYVIYAQQRLDEIHHVLLVVPDCNDDSLKYLGDIPKDRSQRIANLKDAIINLNAHIYPNLNFYVVPISRSGEVAYKILTGAYPLSAEQRSTEIKDVTTLMRLFEPIKLEFSSLNANDFYLAEVQHGLYADGHYQLNNLSTNSSETVLLKMMEEGSVRNLDQLSYLDLLQSEKRFKKPVDKIFAIYSRGDEFDNDVIAKVLPNIYFSSIDHLVKHLNSYPVWYKTVNTSRKEEVRLYEN